MRIFWAFFYGWIVRLLFSRPTSWLGWAGVGLLVLACMIFLDVARYLVYPNVSALKKENPGKTAMMLRREHQWAAEGRRFALRYSWTPYSRISPYAVKAVLIAEDDKFWSHEGFDFEAMGKAIERDIKKRRFSFGGSTITQQLAKNLYLSPSKNPLRKLKEAILTWRMERALSKRRILEVYLNVAEWGDGIFGIEAAANRYYGIPASALGPEQAARLASVLPSPLRYSPVKPSRYVDARSRVIYNIMLRRGIVVPEYPEIVQTGPEDEGDMDEGEKREEVDGNYSSTGPAPVYSGATSGG